MQWKGGQGAKRWRGRARRPGGVARPFPRAISAAPRGAALDLQEGRVTLSRSWCTFPLTDLSLRESELYSQHPEVPGGGGRTCRTTVTFRLGLNTLKKTFLEVEG